MDWWNDDQQRQWLQVQPWNNGDPWNQHGIVASRTGHQLNRSWDQWNRWNANGWSAGVNDDDWWSPRSQWHSEPKKYFDKSPPPESDGNHPEKTWRDYRRTLKQWLSTTGVPSERHGMLLWRALTGDAKLLISVTKTGCFGMLDRGYLTSWLRLTSISASLRTRMTLTMPSTNCTASATRRYYSLRMWPALPSTTPMVSRCLTGRRAWSSSGKPRSRCGRPHHGQDQRFKELSDLLDATQILARRLMSQVSSSFPSYDDEWDDSTNATEYYDIDDHNAVDNDGYYDEYDEPETMMVSGSTCSKNPSCPVCWKISRRAERGRQEGLDQR